MEKIPRPVFEIVKLFEYTFKDTFDVAAVIL